MIDIVKNFDRTAERYEIFAAPQAALAEELAQWIAPREWRGHAIEFGAGTGLFTRHLHYWQGPYLASDAAPRMVALGCQNCPNVAWGVVDARRPGKIGPAEWIFACNLAQWLDEPGEALRAWRGLLKPTGHLMLAVLLPQTLQELQSLLPGASPLHWREAGEWKTLVELADFEIEREQTWEYISVHATARDFLRAVHDSGFAPRRAVGPGRLRAALREYDERYRTAGGVHATWRAWLARAAAR